MKQQEQQDKQQQEGHIETKIAIGDIELHCFEPIDVAYTYMIELIKNPDVKQYLQNFEVRKQREKAGMIG